MLRTSTLLAATLWWLAWPGPSEATQTADPVESGRQALRARPAFPWYDSDQDGLRRIEVRDSLARDANRDSGWTTQWEPKTRQRSRGRSLGLGKYFWEALKLLFWILLAALLLGLVAVMVWTFLRLENTSVAGSSTEEDVDSQEANQRRIENLPFPMASPSADLLSEARREYEAGNFAQAMIYLFSYKLVQLDRHHCLRLARGKTNRQYLRELRKRPQLREILEQSMLTFEDVFFGHYRLERRDFESCWNQLDDFHRQLEATG